MAVEAAHGAHAPLDVTGPGREVMERVVLALVDDVRDRPDHLVRPDEPDLIAGRTVDGFPPDIPRACRLLRGKVRPAHVERLGCAPSGGDSAVDGPDVPVQRRRLS